MRRRKEEYQVELDCIAKTMFLRRDSNRLLLIMKEQRIRKFFDLVSLSTSNMKNLSCTSSSKEILKLDPCKIDLLVVIKEFIKAQKLGPRSDFSSITFEEFDNFWTRQLSMKGDYLLQL